MNTVTAIFVTAFGVCVGSFLNVVIYRVPRHRKFLDLNQRSICPNCRHKLSAPDLVPIFSYLFLRGRCRYCHKPISAQYIVVEVLTGIFFLLTYQLHGASWLSLVGVVGGAALLALAFIDGLKRIVPDSVSLPAIAIVTVGQAIVAWTSQPSAAQALQHLSLVLLAGVTGGAWFAAQWLFSKGKWVGSGDVRIGVLMGMLLGLPGLALALFVAYISGTVWAVALLIRRKANLKSRIPFGVFLGAAGMVCFIFGSSVVSWYQRLIGW